jgi:hypothetical protein
VLSFPSGNPGHLGDVALALGTVRREAREAGRRAADHLAHLVAHGALHLAGHDHLEAGEGAPDGARGGAGHAPPRPAQPVAGGDMSGNGQNGHANDRGLFWMLQGLLRKREAESVRDRVEELIERKAEDESRADDEEDGLDTHERVLLGNVLKLRGRTAYDIMVPRADIVAMPENLSLDQAIRLIQREGHSRFPVYRENLDDIVGMVHIKDVFAASGATPRCSR